MNRERDASFKADMLAGVPVNQSCLSGTEGSRDRAARNKNCLQKDERIKSSLLGQWQFVSFQPTMKNTPKSFLFFPF